MHPVKQIANAGFAIPRAPHRAGSLRYHVTDKIGFVVKFLSPKNPHRDRQQISFTERTALAPRRNWRGLTSGSPTSPARATVAFVASIAIVASATGVSLASEQTRELEQRNVAVSSVVATKARELSNLAPGAVAGREPAAATAVSSATGTTSPTTTTTTTTALAETGRRTYYVRVRTSVKASGANNGQAAINAGGQVAVIWKGVGTIVSAHNYVDSRALKLRAGDVIRFSGAIKGVYRVVNAVKLSKGSPVSSVKKLGMTMMMQTCYFGTGMMRIVGLKLVR